MAEKLASYKSLQHISLQGSAVTTQEQLKACCKLRYKPRRVKNKGAILVLVCNYLIVSVFGLLLKYIATGSEYIACLVVFASTLSVAGWLADVHIGRYKLIHCSVLIMWTAMVLATVSSVTAQLVDSYYHVSIKVK